MEMLPNILFRINELHLIPKTVEFNHKFLYIWKIMNKKHLEKVILSHAKDNVATARIAIEPGALLTFSKGKKMIAKEKIPFAHKIALRAIPKNGPVIKYGERIGKAIREINPGEWVHIHNVTGERGRRKGKIPRPYRRGI
jgi:altronate dehydratase